MRDLAASGVRIRRWRNPIGGPPLVYVRHVAGPVIDVRSPRPSCPRYIADRYQDCSDCGRTLLHGRWEYFYPVGQHVTQLVTAAGDHLYGRPTTEADDVTPCRILLASATAPSGRGYGTMVTMPTRHQRRSVYQGGHLPFGWAWRDGRPAPQIAQQRTRGAILALRADRLSYEVIAGMLNAADRRTSSGGPWRAMAVYRVCNGPILPHVAATLAQYDRAELDYSSELATIRERSSETLNRAAHK